MALTRTLGDTSIFIALESPRRMSAAGLPESTMVSIITVGELRAGVLSARDTRTRDRRLGTLTLAQSLQALVVDDEVAKAWARLRSLLRESGRTMPANDSWIAATALAHRLPVLTQDGDFDAVDGLDGLEVIKV